MRSWGARHPQLAALFLLLSGSCGPPALAQSAAAKPAETPSLAFLEKELREKAAELASTGAFPGITVAAVLPDGRTVSAAAGLSDRETRRPMKPSDRMPAGSIGKTFFAVVTLELVGEGKLELDAKISKYLGGEPWFDRLPNAPDLTLRMLLNHTSGIPEHVESPEFIAALHARPDRVWSPRELLEFTLGKAALFPAGRGWSYADTNYIVVGIVVEKVTGREFYDLVRERILEPGKLRDTIPSTSRTLPGVVNGYSSPASPFGITGPVLRGGRFVINPQMEWTGGGFASTSGDLARWAWIQFHGREPDRSVVPQNLLAERLDGQQAATGPGDRYGLGVQIFETPFGTSYGHGGWFPGYLSEMEYFPEKKIAVAYQINTDEFRALGGNYHVYMKQFMEVLVGALHGRPPTPR